jgi:hypothetical protein
VTDCLLENGVVHQSRRSVMRIAGVLSTNKRHKFVPQVLPSQSTTASTMHQTTHLMLRGHSAQ